jgi:hypothetical protein
MVRPHLLVSRRYVDLVSRRYVDLGRPSAALRPACRPARR